MSELPALKRVLSLPLLTLYGLGTTVGAGIFVLIGKIAGVSGVYAPAAFLLASVLAGLSALCFAELSSRFPEAAGEAAYVRQGLGVPGLALFVGLLVVAAAMVSTSAIIIGFSGYLAEFVPWPPVLTRIAVMVLLGALVCWGIRETATVAVVITILEVGMLIVVIVAGADLMIEAAPVSPSTEGPMRGDIWAGVLAGAMLAFYAFMGFEDMVNVAEEATDASRTMPCAIILTLIATTALYVLVAMVAVKAVPAAELSASNAPLALIFERASTLPGGIVSAVAIVSVLNGAVIQTVMASRILYGLSRHRALPDWLGRVNARTGTPIGATVLCVAAIILLSTTLPVVTLAKAASMVTLAIFAIVDFALLRLKMHKETGSRPHFTVPVWVPAFAALAALALLGYGLWQWLGDIL